MDRLRVFLADDHVLVREALQLLIDAQSDMKVVGQAGTGLTTIKELAGLETDVLILDISMPDLNGDEIVRLIREKNQSLKILVLTMHQETGYVRQLLEAGASGYVTKQAAAMELVKAIKAVSCGELYVTPSLSGEVIGELVGRRAVVSNESSDKLSQREESVLCLIAYGYSNKEIGLKLDISTKTVETYKARAMQKAGLRNRVDIVRRCIERGCLIAE